MTRLFNFQVHKSSSYSIDLFPDAVIFQSLTFLLVLEVTRSLAIRTMSLRLINVLNAATANPFLYDGDELARTVLFEAMRQLRAQAMAAEEHSAEMSYRDLKEGRAAHPTPHAL